MRRKGRRRTLEQMGGSWFIASANQRPAARFHRKSGVPVQRLTISLCSAHTVDLCLLLKRVVLHRSGPAHRVVKRPRQSAQLARAARFASERSVFPALFSFHFWPGNYWVLALPRQRCNNSHQNIGAGLPLNYGHHAQRRCFLRGLSLGAAVGDNRHYAP